MPPGAGYRMPYVGGGMRPPPSSGRQGGPTSPSGGGHEESLDEDDNLWSRKQHQTQREVLSAVEKARQKRSGTAEGHRDSEVGASYSVHLSIQT